MTTAFLGTGWKGTLEALVRSVQEELVIVSPYISVWGVEQVLQWLPSEVAARGRFTLLTDLTPAILIEGATEPQALLNLQARVPRLRLLHQPGLHAKIYVADGRHAIITSGNLTRGGLERNKEGGVSVVDEAAVQEVMAFIRALEITSRPCVPDVVSAYVEAINANPSPRQKAPLPEEVGRAFRNLTPRSTSMETNERGYGAQLRTVFASLILRDLARLGPKQAADLYEIIRSEYPDLCNDKVTRGTPPRPLWKHEARFALQWLKEQGKIERSVPKVRARRGGYWQLAPIVNAEAR